MNKAYKRTAAETADLINGILSIIVIGLFIGGPVITFIRMGIFQ